MEGVSWWTVTKIALGSGAVAAGVSFCLNCLKDLWVGWRRRRSKAELDAIHLIAKLDALSVECANSVWSYRDNCQLWRGTEGEGHIPKCSMPTLDFQAENLEQIDRTTASRIAWLRNEVMLGADVIRSRWENHLDTHDALDQHSNLVGYLGCEAMEISDGLRGKYDLAYAGKGWGLAEVENLLRTCSEDFKKYVGPAD